MTGLKDRDEAFENKFAHDEEILFRATARRNKQLGLWAAEKLGKSGAAADLYATNLVMTDIKEVGDHDVFQKVRADLSASLVSDADIRLKMEALMAEAIEHVKKGA